QPERHRGRSFLEMLRGAARALGRGAVLRWLILLQVTDLMGDVLFGFLALYFVDVVRVSPALAGLAVFAWTAAGLAGDLWLAGGPGACADVAMSPAPARLANVRRSDQPYTRVRTPETTAALRKAPAPKPWTKWSAPSAMSATVARPNAVVATVAANI